uniref:Uncharacterized protein n=1 Tax=Pyramimonas obovata TaxID=1411642 RepID=A0A7S0WP79_9CHLO|mmetsp:Transcript_32502/g.71034  ORF Transcript_32502/g.71034 Transcript_32502/m.71034 type:complete len:478 (+) Transcript_32502:419-1852(+)|eukprot:CAMPEP_0118926436 /NCGR_PEP_ID=MMETSP1169-20130426/4117_1 /TAXON_ID=36882 /ORGANISM="Pyramimonas obovata, Strain CCMP722" /LENGTH=477 /DNA_ID=CAMNT_0006867981 /DNA_START=396 /DNA_END=1829 /DNA_ORIENTATION=-
MGCGVSKETQLYEAVKQGNAKLVHKLVKAGIPHTLPVDSVGSTLLHVAGQLGHAGVIDELCEVSTPGFIEKRNEHGFTALHEAAIIGNSKAILALIEAGANVNSAGPKDNTALHLAAGKGMNTAVKTLVASGADVNAPGQLKESPLHTAARKGKRETCVLLLELGADPSAQDAEGNMPWQVASRGFSGDLVSSSNGFKHPLSFLLRPDRIPPRQNDEKTRISTWISDSLSFHIPRELCIPPSLRGTEERAESELGSVCTETAHAKSDPATDIIIDFWPEDGMTLISLCSTKEHLAVLAAASFHLVERGVSVNQVEVCLRSPQGATASGEEAAVPVENGKAQESSAGPAESSSAHSKGAEVESSTDSRPKAGRLSLPPIQGGIALKGLPPVEDLGRKATPLVGGAGSSAGHLASMYGKQAPRPPAPGEAVSYTFSVVDGATGLPLPEDSHQPMCDRLMRAIREITKDKSEKASSQPPT